MAELFAICAMLWLGATAVTLAAVLGIVHLRGRSRVVGKRRGPPVPR